MASNQWLDELMMQTPAPASAGTRVVADFEFDLKIDDGYSGSRSGPSLLSLASVWSAWWASLAVDIAVPLRSAVAPSSSMRMQTIPGLPRFGFIEDFEARLAPEVRNSGSLDLNFFHPADLELLQFASVVELPGRLATWNERHGPGAANNEILAFRRCRIPGPDTSLVLKFAVGEQRVWRGPEIFCVGLDVRLIDAGPTYWRNYRQFSMGFSELEVSLGSMNTNGKGWFSTNAQSLLFAIIAGAVTPSFGDPLEEMTRSFDISQRLETAKGPCVIEGHISFDVGKLEDALFKNLHNLDRPGICQLQAALLALGYDPGEIDGIWGPHTQAALTSMRNDFNLENVNIRSREFANKLRRALGGEKPGVR